MLLCLLLFELLLMLFFHQVSFSHRRNLVCGRIQDTRQAPTILGWIDEKVYPGRQKAAGVYTFIYTYIYNIIYIPGTWCIVPGTTASPGMSQ